MLILLSRFIYSLNWFVISPALPAIASSGDMQQWMIGTIPLVFFIFTGISQIPSGIVSNKLGAPSTYSIGLILLSFGNILLIINQNFIWVFLTRALSGIGAALFFASAGGVLLNLKPEKPGLMMGLYNVAFALGGGAGLLWGVIHEVLGWKTGILLAGLLGVIVAVVSYIPTHKIKWIGKFSIQDAIGQLRDKNIVNVSIAFTGSWGAYLATGLLLPTYLELGLQQGQAVSGLISAPLLFASIFGGLSAALYDKVKRKKIILFMAGFLSVFPAAFFGLLSKFIVELLLILGFFNEMAITMCYAQGNNTYPEKNTASFAAINTIQILLGMLLLPLVTIIASFSWVYAWIAMSLLGLAPLVFILRLEVR
ncbi:MAG: MFS transporter [Conexivisphaerales archaeon]